MPVHPTTTKTYEQRAALHPNPTARRILETMVRKRSNLCVSVDVTTAKDALEVVKRVGKSVCMVKVRFGFGVCRDASSSILPFHLPPPCSP